jgi:predicted amidohydrolase YtcJ
VAKSGIQALLHTQTEVAIEGKLQQLEKLQREGVSVRPFQTLYWAVTGKMVGGTVVNTHTISREAALIAHTRNNAYLFFRENDLGSIQNGRFADLVVLDRDYMTVPADQIKDIKPILTMIGGRIVYDAATNLNR